MRRIVVKKNGKTYLVTAPWFNDCVWGDPGPGTGSAPYFLPFISTTLPTTQSVHSGSNFSITIFAGPSGPQDYIAFQWQSGSNKNLVDGAHYSGSLTNIFTINSVSSSMAGTYDVLVINQYGAVTSSLFLLQVI
jgi:hypothetical protein